MDRDVVDLHPQPPCPDNTAVKAKRRAAWEMGKSSKPRNAANNPGSEASHVHHV